MICRYSFHLCKLLFFSEENKIYYRTYFYSVYNFHRIVYIWINKPVNPIIQKYIDFIYLAFLYKNKQALFAKVFFCCICKTEKKKIQNKYAATLITLRVTKKMKKKSEKKIKEKVFQWNLHCICKFEPYYTVSAYKMGYIRKACFK